MTNRVLSEYERTKLHPNEVEVISHYEKKTNNKFMRNEIISLKKAIQIATPAQIKKSIDLLSYKYKQNFTDFHYLLPALNIYKGKRGKKKGE